LVLEARRILFVEIFSPRSGSHLGELAGREVAASLDQHVVVLAGHHSTSTLESFDHLFPYSLS
jgi:hypothetical protein